MILNSLKFWILLKLMESSFNSTILNVANNLMAYKTPDHKPLTT